MKSLMALFVALLYFPAVAFCQQEAQYTQYMYNLMPLNPAATGIKEALQMGFSYRQQWVAPSTEGTPQTMMAGIEKGIRAKHIGMGMHLVKDKIGAQQQTSLFLSTAYQIYFSEATQLSFGLALGCSQYLLDGTKLRSASGFDPAVPTGTSNTIRMDAKSGVLLKGENYFIGLSAANIFNNEVDYIGDERNIVSRQRLHYYLTGGFQKTVSPEISWQPSMLLKDDFKGPTSFDITNCISFYKNYTIGFSYRTALSIFTKANSSEALTYRSAAAAILHYRITSVLDIGYSYDFNIGSSRSIYGGSHELQLRLSFDPQ